MINWISLLEEIPEGEDLYFVADDKDYRSVIDSNLFNPYLSIEWQRKKKSNLIFYGQLSRFFKKNFPNIKLADEYDKNKRIQVLVDSGAFWCTHSAIAHLSVYTSFTHDEAVRLIEAAVTNEQIYWIAGDEDVNTFFCRVFEENGKHVKNELQSVFKEKYLPDSSNDQDDDLPF